METCKDCLHYDICSYHAAIKAMHGLIEEKLVYIANQIHCKFFKSKSHHVEIPCYCKECEYYDKGNGECQNSRIYFSDGSHMYVDEDFYCAMGERKYDK